MALYVGQFLGQVMQDGYVTINEIGNILNHAFAKALSLNSGASVFFDKISDSDLISGSFDDPNSLSQENIAEAITDLIGDQIALSDGSGFTFDPSSLVENELVCIRAIQNSLPTMCRCLQQLMALWIQLEKPNLLLNSIFKSLRDQNIISDDAFLLWKTFDDGVCDKKEAVDDCESLFQQIVVARSPNACPQSSST